MSGALLQALGVAEGQCRILSLDVPTAELAQPLHRPLLIVEAAHSHPEVPAIMRRASYRATGFPGSAGIL